MIWQADSKRIRFFRWSLGVGLLLMVGAACMAGGKRPGKSAHGALGPSATVALDPRAPGTFRVVFAGPEGEANEVSELSLVFSRPLRKLELGGSPAPAFGIAPPIAGRWLWVGTRALHFVPETPHLLGSSHYVVTVPAALRALDGTPLGSEYRLEFSTPRLKLVDSEPAPGARDLEASTRFSLRFNQAVDPVQFRAHATLVAEHGGKMEQLSFAADRPDPGNPKLVLVRPLQPLPIHARIKLSVSEHLVSSEGPLEMGAAFELPVETYGPLAVESLNCDRDTPHAACAPKGSWSLELTSPVPLRDLKRALSITPALPLHFDNATDDSSLVSYLSIAAPFRAGTRYTLSVSDQLRDVHGQNMARPFVREIAVDDYFPAVEIGVQGRLLDPRIAGEIPIGALNVDHYVLRSASLSPEDARLLTRAPNPEARSRIFAGLRNLQLRTIRPGAGLNRVSEQRLNLRALLGPSARGAVAIGVDYARHPKDYRSLENFKIVELTDLAITAKLSPDGSLVWVTRISSGEPIPNATVRILGTGPERRYETDSDGIAKIPANEFHPLFDREADADADALFVVQSGADWAFEAARDFLSPWRLPPPIDLSGRRHAYGLVFTERGIYRPGDDVQVKGILRRELSHGNATPVGEEVQIGLYSPDSEQVANTSLKLSRFGTFATRLKVPETAHLGAWQIRVSGLEDPVFESFDVSEYRPVEFKVGVESDRPSYVRGDTARFRSHADYLFGAVMKHAEVHYTVSRRAGFFEVPNSAGFETSASLFHADLEEAALNGGQLLSQNGKLDERGALDFSQKLDLPAQHGPELIMAEAEVRDVSRQSVAFNTSAIVHPAEFYLGLKRSEDSFVSAPGKLSTSVLALSPSGQRLAGKAVKVELVSRRWTVARETRAAGDSQLLSKVVDRVIGSCNLTSDVRPVPCALELPQGGYYLLHATAKDSRGNASESALSVYAIGERGTGFKDSDPLKLGLKSNKVQYQIGETARVLIESPFPEAEALVTVERAGLYRSARLHVRGPTPTIDLPITEDLIPNAFVAVHLVRARTLRDKTALGAPYRVGYTELSIDPEARRLDLALRPDKSDFAPGSEINVDLEVKDRSGKARAAEVTVYAVDEGVLSLTGYKVPDPIPVFSAARPLGVATLESREGLAKIALEALDGGLGDDKGREGGGGGLSPARRDFRQTAYFNPSVLTDLWGKAHLHFKLPESLTTYRIMAVAVSDGDYYGFASSSVTTSKRLMARPALPRFLRSGDRLEAGVVLSAKNFDPGQVTVQAHSTGVTLLGNPTRTLSLDRDRAIEVRFPFQAEHAGQARFRFEVSAGAERDAVTQELRIDSPATLEAVALYGKSQDSVQESVGDLATARPDVGDLELSVASTALVGIGAGVEQLIDYPYACTEQLSSKLIPLVPLRDLAKDFKLPLPPDTDRVVTRTIAEIVSRQHGDGGFGLWPSSTESYPWVGAYALFVLSQAKQHGVSVPSAVFDRGQDFLRRYLAEHSSDGLRLPTMAFVLDVLAEMGFPDIGYQQQLFERRKELPLFGKALLLHALGVSRGQPTLVQALRPEVENALRLENDAVFVGENVGDEYAVLMDSPTRTAALVLRALLAVQPDHPLAAGLARGLLAQRQAGSWRTTQETSYSLLALDAYRKAQEKVVPDFRVKVLLGRTELLDAAFHTRSSAAEQTRVDMLKIASAKDSALLFEKRGSGTMFYQARLRYAVRTLPTDSLDQGFFVQKILRPVTAEALPEALSSMADSSVARFPAADLVLTDLLIATPSPRNFVVVDDPLPAGFEAVDSHLTTSSRGAEVLEGSDEPCDDCGSREEGDTPNDIRASFEAYDQRELRDDRVLFFIDHMVAGIYHFRYLARATGLGKFVLPPTRAFEMYSPETFGRTGASSVSIE